MSTKLYLPPIGGKPREVSTAVNNVLRRTSALEAVEPVSLAGVEGRLDALEAVEPVSLAGVEGRLDALEAVELPNYEIDLDIVFSESVATPISDIIYEISLNITSLNNLFAVNVGEPSLAPPSENGVAPHHIVRKADLLALPDADEGETRSRINMLVFPNAIPSSSVNVYIGKSSEGRMTVSRFLTSPSSGIAPFTVSNFVLTPAT